MSPNLPSDTHNPWSDQEGQSIPQQRPSSNPYESNTSSTNPYETTNTNQPPYPDHPTFEPQSQNPLHQQPYQEPPANHNPWAQHPSQPQQPSQNPWDNPTQSSNPQSQPFPHSFDQTSQNPASPPTLPPRAPITEAGLPTGQDRTEQLEAMQSFEGAGHTDEHDRNVEILQREFPDMDGSLIAAIYGDSLSLSATREMLGALR